MNKPITHEEMKAWIDETWENCQSKAWKEPRQWVGLTDDDYETLSQYAFVEVIEKVEVLLKEKNSE